MLEIEKNTMKVELGRRLEVNTREEHDVSAVWEKFSILTSNLAMGAEGGHEGIPSGGEGLEH